jgi:hypothetical protein
MLSRAPWTGRASSLPWRGFGRAAWLLLSDLAVGELADDVEVADVAGALLDQVEQDPPKCRGYAAEGEAAFEPRSCRQHSSPYPHPVRTHILARLARPDRQGHPRAPMTCPSLSWTPPGREVLLVVVLGIPELLGRCDLCDCAEDPAAETKARRPAPTGRGKPLAGTADPRERNWHCRSVLRDVGYARVSSSTGMVRTPAVWRAYSANPG